ncbi:coiled-coil domain-containing protein 150 [Mugil cephalus]|uniref:coiled-coil domain-containing protein 150 n=1 Tax=Mugil cephalus TaxID=48193 RepID=UPI001FB57524|nr:coiled-coil domain-containing protein 150 [Mugil cephalus]
MSSSAIRPVHAGDTAPEALFLLQRRLLMAEEGTEALVRAMDELGVSTEQILGSAETAMHPVSPLKMHQFPGEDSKLWQQYDFLVSRVCRMESLLQTLELTIFRLKTERELDPSHTVYLKQQLAAMQQESEQEQQASRSEMMTLRDQLQQAYRERDRARAEVQKLGDALEGAAAARADVALAAEELKVVKMEMSQKVMEMREQMRQESIRSHEAMKSHSELLERVEETERVVEMERRQALLLQSDCQAWRAEVQSSRQQLAEERGRGRRLEELCQQLREQTAIKDSVVSALKTELKRQQTENSKLLKDIRELRAAADRVQAERSRAVSQLQKQDLLQEATRCNLQTELQVALRDKVHLEKELEKLKGAHALLLQSSSITQGTAASHKKLQERTIEKLQRELITARGEEEAMREDLEGSKNELRLVVTKLEGERSCLDAQLKEARRDVGSLSSALQSQQDENRRLMGELTALGQQQQISEQEALQDVCGFAEGVVSQTLENLYPSNDRLQFNTLHQELGGREQELATLKKDRVKAHREIRKHQAEVEKLQGLLTSTHSKSNRALESLQKALAAAREDNKTLAHSLEQAVLTNNSLHSKLQQARDQYQATITLRDDELRTKISHLSTDLSAAKQQNREYCESSVKTLHREISELKLTVKDSSTKSDDLSKTNQVLLRRVSELERQVSKQKACIREQRSQLRQQQRSRDSRDHSQKVKALGERNGDLHEKEQADQELKEVRVESERQLTSKREAEWERWTSTIQRWEDKREGWLASLEDASLRGHS